MYLAPAETVVVNKAKLSRRRFPNINVLVYSQLSAHYCDFRG